jgi:hypothetical protein
VPGRVRNVRVVPQGISSSSATQRTGGSREKRPTDSSGDEADRDFHVISAEEESERSTSWLTAAFPRSRCGIRRGRLWGTSV